MATTFASGVNFSWPTKRDTNYSGVVNAALAALSAHKHEGNGTGVLLGPAAFSANALTGTKFRLANAEYLRARNAANSADVNLLRLNSSDALEVAPTTLLNGVTNLRALQPITTGGGASIPITGNVISLSNAGAQAITIPVPTSAQAGMPVLLYNSGAGTYTVTITGRPAASDVVTIPTLCSCLLYPIGTTTWSVIASPGVTFA